MSQRLPVYMALVHYPVRNRLGDRIATAVTNLDVHDGGRIAATFGLRRYFLVTPVEEQRALVSRIHEHWTTGPGGKKNPKRKIAMSLATPVETLQDACDAIAQETGSAPLLVGTSARPSEYQAISYGQLRQQIHEPNTNEQDARPVLLVFGTGWGLTDDLEPAIDLMLPPILGDTDYNHLSVRAAIAITIDRLLGNIHA